MFLFKQSNYSKRTNKHSHTYWEKLSLRTAYFGCCVRSCLMFCGPHFLRIIALEFFSFVSPGKKHQHGRL